MPFYPSDWMAATAHLDAEEYRAYHILLCLMWERAKPGAVGIPDRPEIVSRLIGRTAAQWGRIRQTLVETPGLAVMTSEDGLLIQPRLVEEWRKAESIKEFQTERARKASRARWGDGSGNASGNAAEDAPSSPPGNASGDPSSNAPSNASSMREGCSEECLGNAMRARTTTTTTSTTTQVVGNREVDAYCEDSSQALSPPDSAAKPREREPETALCVRKTDPPSPYSTEFERFWTAYPERRGLKDGKREAWKAWVAADGNRPPVDVLVAVLEDLARTDQWRQENGRFIPMPAKWIEKRGWEAEIARKPKTSGEALARWMQASPALAKALGVEGSYAAV
jgi:uncharacterized protein YdaU (DUF1376 family)